MKRATGCIGIFLSALLNAAPSVSTLSLQTPAQNETINPTLHTLSLGDPGSSVYGDANNFYRDDHLAVRMADNCFYLFDQDGRLNALFDLAAGKRQNPDVAGKGRSPCINETSARMRLPSRPEEIMKTLRDDAEGAFQSAVNAATFIESKNAQERIKAVALTAKKIADFIGSRKSVYVNAELTLALAKRLESLAENSVPMGRGKTVLQRTAPGPFTVDSGKSGSPDSQAAENQAPAAATQTGASRGASLRQENSIAEAAIAGLDSLPSVIKLSRHYSTMNVSSEKISAESGAAAANRSDIKPASACDKRDQLVNFDNADTNLAECLETPKAAP